MDLNADASCIRNDHHTAELRTNVSTIIITIILIITASNAFRHHTRAFEKAVPTFNDTKESGRGAANPAEGVLFASKRHEIRVNIDSDDLRASQKRCTVRYFATPTLPPCGLWGGWGSGGPGSGWLAGWL
jgi:hypothetical protein